MAKVTPDWQATGFEIRFWGALRRQASIYMDASPSAQADGWP